MRILVVFAALALFAAGPDGGSKCDCAHPADAGGAGHADDLADGPADRPCCPEQDSRCDCLLTCACCQQASVLVPEPVATEAPASETAIPASSADPAPAGSGFELLRPPIA